MVTFIPMRAFCTVVSCSHLLPALALASSLQAADNHEELHVLVIDSNPGSLPDSFSGVVFHGIDEFSGHIPALMPYYFDAFELCNSLKPFIVSRLFACGFSEVIYLDSDIYVVGSFDPAWHALQYSPLLLTPHQLNPPSMAIRHLIEKDIVDMGVYNGGFSAWKHTASTLRILEWMCQRFPMYAFNRRSKGMFVDQKLMPLIPIYFPDDVCIWRDPRVNVAYWNAHERPIVKEGECFYLSGEPVIFFHLSGFRTSRPELACIYLSQVDNNSILANAPWFSSVMRKYSQLCSSTQAPSIPVLNRFSYFKGFRLTPELREILFKKGDLSFADIDVWREFVIGWLRLIKRRLFALFSL